MGRACTVCGHEDLDEINRLLLSGTSFRDIAGQFDLSKTALARHKESHIQELLSKSSDLKAEVESTQGNQTLAEVRELKVRALEILEEAQSAGDLKTALLGIREARSCLELCMKAEGRIQEQSVNVTLQQVSIYQSPEWSAVGDILVKVLAGYPELKAEVAREFVALERGANGPS